MRRDSLSFLGVRVTCAVLSLFFFGFGQRAMAAQKLSTATNASAAASARTLVPQLIKFSGTLADLAGKPISGPVDVTFSLYSQESGGSPLWYESQTVNANAAGEYTTLLGAMTATGVPMDLFTSGQARWLGVAVRGLPEQSRILLVSVPYAMTSGNAEMLGGKPAADYLLASQSGTSSTTTATTGLVGTSSTTNGRTAKQASTASPQSITMGPTANYIAGWESDGSTLGASNIYQDPTTNDIGIGTTAPLASAEVAGSLSTSTPATVLDLSRNYNSGVAYTSAASFLLSNPKVGTKNSRLDIALRNANSNHDVLPDTTVMSLVSNGNVGIGTTNPTSQLEVASTGGANGTSIAVADQVDGTSTYGYAQEAYQLSNPNFNSGAGKVIFSFGAEGDLSNAGDVTNSDFYIFDPAGTGDYEAVFQGSGTSGGGKIGLGTSITDASTLAGAGLTIDSSGNVGVAGNLAVAGDISGNGSNLTGVVSSDLAAGTYSNLLDFSNSSDTFAGTAATATNATELGGVAASGYAPATGSAVYVAKAGDTMTGALNLPSDGLVAGTTQLVLASGEVGIGTASPGAVLDVVGSNGANDTTNVGGAAAPIGFLATAGAGGTDFAGDYGGGGAQVKAEGGLGGVYSHANQLPYGGAGGVAQLLGGNGGADSSGDEGGGGARITASGGDGAEDNLYGYGNGGNGGSITLQPGAGGSAVGGGLPGVAGNVLLAPSGGMVAIGTSSPTEALTVAGSITIADCYYYNGTSNNVGGVCSSDARLKKNIQPFASVLDQVAELQPVYFNWRATNPAGYPTSQARARGLIAQQVQKVFPGLVTFDKNGYRRVDYGALPLLTLEGLRELKTRNDNLAFQVQAQRRKIGKLAKAGAAKDAKIAALTHQVAKLQKEASAVEALEARLNRDEAQNKATRTKLARVMRQEKKNSRTELARVQF